MFQAHLPIRFWGECVLSAAHLINRTPCELHKGKSPYEIIFGKSPMYSEIQIFGCLAYAHNQKRDGDKFASRSRKCVFLGYPYAKKGWTLFDLDTHEFFISRDVTFVEDKFPYLEETTVPRVDKVDFGNLGIFEENFVESASVSSQSRGSDADVSHNVADVSHGDAEVELVDSGVESEPVMEEPLGRGQRQHVPSVRLKDYVTYNTRSQSEKVHSSHLPDTPSLPSKMVQGTTSHPISRYVSDCGFSQRHQVFLAAVSAGKEPRSYKEAILDERWRKALKSEVDAFELNKTWVLENLPKGKKAIGSKWIFKIKYNADGTVERYKARLVCLGNHQVEGEDYDETFAPVAKMSTVRTLLQVAVAKDWEVHQMDVNNAFLHGDLEEEVYMKLPPGFKSDDPNKVCRLKKSLYGLKQAPRCWFAKLTTALKEFGFVQSYSDYSLFTYIKGDKNLRVLVYVDDLVVAGNDLCMLTKFKTYLSQCFKMKDLGKLKYFLGIEIARGEQGMYLTQRKYALDIISEAGLLGCKPVSTPIEQNHKLLSDNSPAYKDPARFRRVVGRLVYLTITRPELCYTVHVLSQVMHDPRETHWDAAVRVIRYLKGCPGQGIMLLAKCDLKVRVFCDSDWASCPKTRRSLSAYVVFLGNSAVTWKTKKQDTVSHSSAEAEYRAMAAALRELKWLRGLLADLGVKQEEPMQMFCDSKSAIHIAANPVFHERTKHIEADCHSVRDAVQARLIVTPHVKTTEQVADLMTKALGSSTFQYLMSKLGICNLHAPT